MTRLTRRLLTCALLGAMLAPAQAAWAQEDDTTICDGPEIPGAPHLVMMLWRGPTEVERGVRDQLLSQGIEINVTCLSADSSRDNLPTMVARARELAPDLVYTWGTSVTLGTVGAAESVDPEQHITDIPAIFTMVSYPIESGLVPSFEDTGRNITGSSHTVPLEAQIRAMQTYRTVSSIGVLYNPLEVNSVINIQQLTAAAEASGIDVIALPVPLNAEGEPDPDSLEGLMRRLTDQQPQFLFIGPDSFIGTHREAVIGLAMERGLPAFTGTELEIANGRAMVGLVTSYYNLGRYMGSLIERVMIDGEDPADIPVRTLSRFTYIVRLPVARELELYPALEILDFAEIITEPLQ